LPRDEENKKKEISIWKQTLAKYNRNSPEDLILINQIESYLMKLEIPADEQHEEQLQKYAPKLTQEKNIQETQKQELDDVQQENKIQETQKGVQQAVAVPCEQQYEIDEYAKEIAEIVFIDSKTHDEIDQNESHENESTDEDCKEQYEFPDTYSTDLLTVPKSIQKLSAIDTHMASA